VYGKDEVVISGALFFGSFDFVELGANKSTSIISFLEPLGSFGRTKEPRKALA
jgi:hypothetical protein